jgi:hypothetical protein
MDYFQTIMIVMPLWCIFLALLDINHKIKKK